MIPVFVKRLSSRLTGGLSGTSDNSATPAKLSKKDTIELPQENEAGPSKNSKKDSSIKKTSLTKESTLVLSKSNSRSSNTPDHSIIPTNHASSSFRRSSIRKTSETVLFNKNRSELPPGIKTGHSKKKLTKESTLALSKSNSRSSNTSQRSVAPADPIEASSSFNSRRLFEKNRSLSHPVGPSVIPKVLSKKKSSIVIKPVTRSRQPEKKRGNVELWFYRGEFVSVRANKTGDELYICRLLQNVYNNSAEVKIRWVEFSKSFNCYRLTNYETVDPACLVMSITLMDRKGVDFWLYDEDIKESKEIIKRINNKDSTLAAADDFLPVEQVEPPVKKVKIDPSRPVLKLTKKGKKATNVVSSIDDDKGRKRKKAKKSQKPELIPRPDVKIIDKDPLFETRKSCPNISASSDAKLLFRVAILNDTEQFKKLSKDKKKYIPPLGCRRSVVSKETPIQYAIKYNNKEILEKFLKSESRYAAPAVESQTRKLETGSYNPRSIGVEYVRPITVSRGVKEGDEAFNKDDEDYNYYLYNGHQGLLEYAFKHNADVETIEVLLKAQMEEDNLTDMYDDCLVQPAVTHFDLTLAKGQRKVLSKFLERAFITHPACSKLQLYQKVLIAESVDELKGQTPPSAVINQARQYKKMSPIHFAAINPKVEIMEKLLSVNPDFQVSDSKNRRPIHFAAGCEEVSALEFLISRGANMFDADSFGWIPLHYAIDANRVKNVEYLLKLANEDTNPFTDPYSDKYGKGSINRPVRNTRQPLHIAASNGYSEMIKVLIKYGAQVDSLLGITQMKLSPLMLACAEGHLDSVKVLINNASDPEKTDRLLRTPLIHAAMNGNTHIVTYLLHIGVCINRGDSSNNTPLHYAAAYGWYFTTKCLVDNKCKLDSANDWKTTALSIAYEKGHIGIVHLLLNNFEDAGINFKDDSGNNLIMKAVTFPNTNNLVEEIEFILDKGALSDLTNNLGKNALHLLADKKILYDKRDPSKLTEQYQESMKNSVKIAKLFSRSGVNLCVNDHNGMTPLTLALMQGNIKLAAYLMELDCKFVIDSFKNSGDNMLHGLIGKMMETDFDYVLPMLRFLTKPPLKTDDTEEMHDNLKLMASEFNSQGFTPFLYACHLYQAHQQKINLKKLVEFFIDICEVNLEEKFKKTDDSPRLLQSADKWLAVDFLCSIVSPEQEVSTGQALQVLIDHDVPLNNQAEDGLTTLARAIRNNKAQLTKLLLKGKDGKKADPNLPIEVTETKDGKLEILKVPLLYELCTIDPYGEDGESEKKIDIIKLLCKMGIDVNDQHESEKYYILHHLLQTEKSAARDEFCQKVIPMFKFTRPNMLDAKDRNVLHIAFNSCSGDMDEDLSLEHFLVNKFPASLKRTDYIGRVPLHYIFVKEYNHTDNEEMDPIELCRLTGNLDTTQIQVQDKFGKTPLHYAAFRGATLCCNYLITRGADINLKDNNGNTPLACAILGSHDHCARLFVQNNADTDIEVVETHKPTTKYWHWKPLKKSGSEYKPLKLFEAVLKFELNGVMFMLMDLLGTKNIDMTTVIETALNCKKYSFVMKQFANLANMDAKCVFKERHGRNWMHMVALVDDQDDQEWQMFIVKRLVSKDVSLTIKDSYKCSPLFYCFLQQKLRLADYLVKTLPTLFRESKSLLTAFLWKYKDFDSVSESLDFVKNLIKKTNLNQLFNLPIVEETFGHSLTCGESYFERKSDGDVLISPLIYAILKDDFQLTKLFLENDADVNLPDSNSRTPLMHAVRKNNVKLVKLLFNHSYGPDKTAATTHKAPAMFGFKWFGASSGDDDDDDENDDIEDDDEGDKDNDDKQEKSDDPYETVKVTSKIDINFASESDGYTCLHHLVNPLDSYQGTTFDNEGMLYVLCEAGADLTIQNIEGQTPLELALFLSASNAAKMIQKYEKIEEKDMDLPELQDYEDVNDGSILSSRLKGCNPKLFVEDSMKMIKLIHPDNDDTADEEMTADIIQPDISPQCGVQDGILIKDESQDLLYSVLLHKIDIGGSYSISAHGGTNGSFGLYNFYLLQLVKQPAKDLFILFTCWGRVGDKGQFQTTPFQAEDEAVKNFMSIFKSKTGNSWSDVKSFVANPKKYNLVDAIWNKKPKPKKEVKIDLNWNVKSMLPVNLQDIIKSMITHRAMENDMDCHYYNDNLINEKVMAFGYLDDKVIQSALNILTKIGEVQKKLQDLKANNTTPDPDQVLKHTQQICKLSSDYYVMTPRTEFAFEAIKPLSDINILAREKSKLKNLLNIETTTKILLGAMYHQKDLSPTDYVYKAVGCEMEIMKEDNAMAQYIMCSMVDQNGSSVRVKNIYKLKRQGEEERLNEANITNRALLWHGSDLSNFIGILHRGLVCTPFDTQNVIGQLFGEGIYFADDFQKSQRYCSSTSGLKLVLLAEVGLGKQYKIKQDSDIKDNYVNYDSIKVEGQKYRNPNGDIYLPTGTKMCIGNKLSRYFDNDVRYIAYHNEYIVFKESQICLRYLVVYEDDE